MILPMAKVQVIGPREQLDRTLAFLQARGVLQLRESDAEGEGARLQRLEPTADAEGLARALAEAAERAAALAARLPETGRPRSMPSPSAAAPVTIAPAGSGGGLPSSTRSAAVTAAGGASRDGVPSPPRGAGAGEGGGEGEPLPEPGGPELLARLAALEEEVTLLSDRRAALLEEQEATARFERLVVALAPIRHRIDPSLSPEIHGLFLKEDPEALALLAQETGRITDGRYDLEARPLGDGNVGVLLTVPRSASRELAALLFAHGVEEVRLPEGFAGKPLIDVLLLLAARRQAIPREIEQADAALRRIADAFGPSLALAERRARAALDRLHALDRCGATRSAFVVAGWTPAGQVAALRAAAEEELGGAVVVASRAPSPGEWGKVPVVLSNPRWLQPFQLLLALVPLPRYGSVDPTPWLAVSFPLFFGFVLGDVVFGLLAGAAALLALRLGWGGRMGRDVAAVALVCAASALLFGLLFGEALGDLGAAIGLRPLLFHRRHEVMTFLWLAVAVGGAHVLVGAALGAWTAIRAGHRREAVARLAKLGLLAAAAVAAVALAGWLPRPWLFAGLSVLGLLALVAVAAEGPMAALELVLGLGNVLSYSRLMALGLASAMLADVANAIGRALEPAVAGIAIGVLLHTVNFSLGLVSPVVAALRLHYVEFFERFYEEGGEPFRPFALAG